jgi:hypothetical protein
MTLSNAIRKSGVSPSQSSAKLRLLEAASNKFLALMAELGVEGGVLMSGGGTTRVSASSARLHARITAAILLKEERVEAVLRKKFKDKVIKRLSEEMMDTLFVSIFGKTRSSPIPGVDTCPFFEDEEVKKSWWLSNREKCTYKQKVLLLKATLHAIEEDKLVAFNAS